MTPRKKALRKLTVLSIISIALMIASAVLFALLSETQSYAGVFIVTAIIFLIVFVVSCVKHTQVIRSTCSECGEFYVYDTDVDAELNNVKTNAKNQTANVRFDCTCHNCGKSKTFYKEFTIASIDNNGNVTQHDLRTLARRYFKY
jgi:rubredoxin